MMGLSKILNSGRLSINAEARLIEIGNTSYMIPFDNLSGSDWGYVYEKYVGQIYEDEGYEVIYNGLNLGVLDKGIDLIAKKNSNITLIQCKYHKDKLSKNKIEWILHKASNELYKTYTREMGKLIFVLVVNCMDDNFSKKVPKGFNVDIQQRIKSKYPLVQYYLYHNYLQNKVKLDIREIKMDTYMFVALTE